MMDNGRYIRAVAVLTGLPESFLHGFTDEEILKLRKMSVEELRKWAVDIKKMLSEKYEGDYYTYPTHVSTPPLPFAPEEIQSEIINAGVILFNDSDINYLKTWGICV